MIGSDVLQRLIGATALLTDERTVRAIGSQNPASTNAQSTFRRPTYLSNPNTLINRGQRHFTQSSTWPSAPIMPADTITTAPAATGRNDVPIAPISYLETVADAAVVVRSPEQPIPQLGVTTPYILYASVEMALALSRATAAPNAVLSAGKQRSKTQSQSRAEQRHNEQQSTKALVYVAIASAVFVIITLLAAAIFM